MGELQRPTLAGNRRKIAFDCPADLLGGRSKPFADEPEKGDPVRAEKGVRGVQCLGQSTQRHGFAVQVAQPRRKSIAELLPR